MDIEEKTLTGEETLAEVVTPTVSETEQEEEIIHINIMDLDEANDEISLLKKEIESLKQANDALELQLQDPFIANYLNKGDVPTHEFIEAYRKVDYSVKCETNPYELFSEYYKYKYPFAKADKIQSEWLNKTDGAETFEDLSLSMQGVLMEYAKELQSNLSDTPTDYVEKRKSLTQEQTKKLSDTIEDWSSSIKGKKVFTDKDGKVGYQTTEEDIEWVKSVYNDIKGGKLSPKKELDILLLAKCSNNAVRLAVESKISNAKKEVLDSAANVVDKGLGQHLIPASSTIAPDVEEKMRQFAKDQVDSFRKKQV